FLDRLLTYFPFSLPLNYTFLFIDDDVSLESSHLLYYYIFFRIFAHNMYFHILLTDHHYFPHKRIHMMIINHLLEWCLKLFHMILFHMVGLAKLNQIVYVVLKKWIVRETRLLLLLHFDFLFLVSVYYHE